MPYILEGRDYKDALPRRMDVRAQHLEGLAGLKAAGKVLYAAAHLDDAGNLNGSLMVLDLSREEIDAYLKTEPYILNRVWETWEVIPCKPAPGFEKKT